ncbi:MAG: hypothetical protein VB119_11275 [Candidatus Metalachnospira sp.]|nr:hypothetical protein [Candidatus Metalachnospira sp.]
MKRTAAIFVSVVMTIAFGTTALADEITYYINSADVTKDIEIGGEGNSNTYVITGTGAATSHRIIVNGATTTITLKNVNIVTVNESAIDIGDDADVELVVSGENNLTVTNLSTEAGIHVSGGSLTISGTDADDDILNVTNTNSQGATIGSNGTGVEDFTGTITIDGGVTVNSGGYTFNSSYGGGVGIGAGMGGDMSGTITINEGSVVIASSGDEGAGIGAGEYGDMSGTIIINGGEVSATSYCDGAGIGAGDVGQMSGTIIINGGDVTAYGSGYGAGIGISNVGYYQAGDMTGTIEINGGTVTAYSRSGAAIGAGYNADSGDIIIHSNAVVNVSESKYYYEEERGMIGAFYESTGTIYLYKGATINGITVENVEDLKEAGILNDNMEVELLEEETGETYSLGKLSIVSRINTSKAGDTVYVYESELSKGKLPYYVLEALAKTDNVTLIVVSDSGETAEIKSSSIPEKGKNAFFTVEELLDMAK